MKMYRDFSMLKKEEDQPIEGIQTDGIQGKDVVGPITFPMTDDDLELADMACRMIRGYLDKRNLSSKNIVIAGHALYAFERLPKITPNSSSAVRLKYKYDREIVSVNFSVSEQEFSVDIDGDLNMGAGSDGYSGSKRIVYASGDKAGYIESYELGEQIVELYNMGGIVRVAHEPTVSG